MQNEQRKLVEMENGETATINGKKVLKLGNQWIIGALSTYDLPTALKSVAGIPVCPCGDPQREGHPKVGQCSRGIGGVRL